MEKISNVTLLSLILCHSNQIAPSRCFYRTLATATYGIINFRHFPLHEHGLIRWRGTFPPLYEHKTASRYGTWQLLNVRCRCCSETKIRNEKWRSPNALDVHFYRRMNYGKSHYYSIHISICLNDIVHNNFSSPILYKCIFYIAKFPFFFQIVKWSVRQEKWHSNSNYFGFPCSHVAVWAHNSTFERGGWKNGLPHNVEAARMVTVCQLLAMQ